MTRPSKIKGLLEELVAVVKRQKPLEQSSTVKHHPQKNLGDPEEIARRYHLPYFSDLSEFPFVKDKVTPLPYSFAKSHLLLPLEERDGALLVAMTHPFDLETLEEVRCQVKRDIREALAPKAALEEAIERCYHQKENEASEFIASLQQDSDVAEIDEEDGYDLLEKAADSPVIHMLNVMLAEAIQQGASDIHFEPLENGLGVRYRIDGVLQQRHAPPKEFQSQLITRIKVMARLDIAEHRLPQDGRIKLRMGGRQIDFRVSTVPVVFGERIVLRILDKGNVLLGLNKIGMRHELLAPFSKLINLSEGIVLVTGPTGSGKTTTLYSALSEINNSEMNIMTIEDPVEYKLQGMAQIGVNPKIHLTFATGLRHILRQDPDIIMIGEIRDKETAEIAIQASLTGHLVLSTLHTNDAPSALTRLVDMGIEPYLLTSSVVGILAQRLVRLICPQCRIGYSPSDQELKELGVSRDILPNGKLFKGQGCSHCFGSGFKGRHGIYELMPLTSAIKRQLLQSPDALALQRAALEAGMSGLRQEGAILAVQGVTASSEVLRVTRGCEEI
ncbi:MAG: type II secretion system ATPase GspE [Candidatus Melainabacteria bacterium]|nr:type II secretion system ATPase GspE [Candidatus Melainabacteria bacterium]